MTPLYVVYFAVCVFTPLNHTPNSEQCVMAVPPLEFHLLAQCRGALETAKLRFSTKKGQDALFKETPLPHMVGGKLHFISKCESYKEEDILYCIDCGL
jgi:hypothetical protein